MKKLSIVIAMAIGVLLCGTTTSYGQTADTTGTTTLNVVLHPAISITVNDPSVTLNFVTPQDYANGVDTLLKNHLTVTSTSGFSVKVKADGDLMNGTNSIPIGDIEISGAAGSTIPSGGVALPTAGTGFTNNLALSNANQTFFTTTGNTTGTPGSNIDVTYKAVGGADFTGALASVVGSATAPQTYTAIITYTITAP